MPSPEVLHMPVEVGPETIPAKDGNPLLQIVWSGPALTVGDGVIIILAVSFAAGHTPLAVELKITFTKPVEASPALGLYVVFKLVVEVNAPVPVVAHWPVEENPEIVPVNITELLFAQTVWSGPAFAIGIF